MAIQKEGQWDKKGIALLLPSLIGFSIIYLIPFVYMLLRSFYNPYEKGFLKFFGNYKSIFTNTAFQLSIFNTLIFMGIAIPLIMIFSYFLALSLHHLKLAPWVKLLLILPIALPSGASIGFFQNLFGASYDSLLYSNFNLAVLIIIFIWKYTGYNLLIFSAGFKLMKASILDSAKIDGANTLQIIRHIIFPLSIPYIAFALVVTIINSFKIFKEVYVLQGCYPSTNFYMFQHFINNKFSDMAINDLSSAATLFSLIIVFIAFLLVQMDRRHKARMGEKI